MHTRKLPNPRNRKIGKRVGGAVYLHASALRELEPKLLSVLEQAKADIPEGLDWSVVKLDLKSGNRVSFLDYEDFDQSAFPVLRASCTIDLTSGLSSVRNYSSENPPILHRKELLLAGSDPRRTEFSAITSRLEELGLFKNMHKMGHRRAWEEALRMSGADLHFLEPAKNSV